MLRQIDPATEVVGPEINGQSGAVDSRLSWEQYLLTGLLKEQYTERRKVGKLRRSCEQQKFFCKKKIESVWKT